ncbi:transcriptional regulator, TetR family [Klenkia marina]|uniref:Transcriptional regulator, TetR family n=1 Tax=Klenkia marina TaxID=1960309 RepID=A0A1G4YWN9_9ACTN|nr:TetR/AcrR family transcriptional regulator [Klenkia marina]SCX57846.1 transcriptional regulator, TetR family [Klenkia marina]
MPAREDQRRATWLALQAAAVDLVGRHGFAAVTVDDVAAAAGVSRRTFFNHFPTKAAALFDPEPDAEQRLAALLEAADTTAGAWPALRGVLVAFAAGEVGPLAVRRRLVAEHPELDAYVRSAHAYVGGAVGAWSRRRLPDDPFGARLLTETAGAVLSAAFAVWQPDDDPAHFAELVAAGVDRVTVSTVG